MDNEVVRNDVSADRPCSHAIYGPGAEGLPRGANTANNTGGDANARVERSGPARNRRGCSSTERHRRALRRPRAEQRRGRVGRSSTRASWRGPRTGNRCRAKAGAARCRPAASVLGETPTCNTRRAPARRRLGQLGKCNTNPAATPRSGCKPAPAIEAAWSPSSLL